MDDSIVQQRVKELLDRAKTFLEPKDKDKVDEEPEPTDAQAFVSIPSKDFMAVKKDQLKTEDQVKRIKLIQEHPTEPLFKKGSIQSDLNQIFNKFTSNRDDHYKKVSSQMNNNSNVLKNIKHLIKSQAEESTYSNHNQFDTSYFSV